MSLHAFDLHGHTPLMVAVKSPSASLEVLEFLIGEGAPMDDISREPYEGRNVLSLAIRSGDPAKVALLIEKGADVHYASRAGYDALLDAAYGANYRDSPELITLIRLLIAKGAALDTASQYNETAIGTFSRFGRFDAVRTLIEAGADPARLKWTPLHRAVAIGTFDEVRELVESGADIEERDHRDRTPFLLAVQAGDIDKAEFLLERGATSRARGHCDTPALHCAIESHRTAMLEWLIRLGADIEQTNQFGATPLITAAEYHNEPAIRALLARGANTEAQENSQTALAFARDRDIIIRLLDAGADPRQLGHEGQRILIGLGEISPDPLLDISKDQFLEHRLAHSGTSNPEEITAPFWEAMIRAGVNAYQGAQMFGAEHWTPGAPGHPIWCAQRFGQSLTRLPDGRIIQIGGEHEDSYDPDFCIYNDVFIHHPNGKIQIFCYPQDVFPPTDFHSATLVGKHIYVIGSLGYQEARLFGETQVLRLDTDTLQFERLYPTGTGPGWISRHRARLVCAHLIRITGGNVSSYDGRKESYLRNDKTFVLDIQNLVWRADA